MQRFLSYTFWVKLLVLLGLHKSTSTITINFFWKCFWFFAPNKFLVISKKNLMKIFIRWIFRANSVNQPHHFCIKFSNFSSAVCACSSSDETVYLLFVGYHFLLRLDFLLSEIIARKWLTIIFFLLNQSIVTPLSDSSEMSVKSKKCCTQADKELPSEKLWIEAFSI